MNIDKNVILSLLLYSIYLSGEDRNCINLVGEIFLERITCRNKYFKYHKIKMVFKNVNLNEVSDMLHIWEVFTEL